MHVSADRAGQRRRRAGLVLVALAALLAVVAVASTGGTELGSGSTRRPSQELADALLSLLMVAFVLAAVVTAYLYITFLRSQTAEDMARRRARRKRTLIGFLVLILLLGLAARSHWHFRPLGSSSHSGAQLRTPRRPSQRNTGYQPHFAATPVAVVLGAAAIAALAAFLSYRSRRRSLEQDEYEPSLALDLADVLAETLDDLRAQPDPRTAVIAAYARLERALTAYGVPRRDSDAPGEYLQRILIDLEVGARHASRLTQLFEDAKFSSHPIGVEKKEEAITLLELIRADLYAADAARKAALAQSPLGGEPA
jgi:hypothetical protein